MKKSAERLAWEFAAALVLANAVAFLVCLAYVHAGG